MQATVLILATAPKRKECVVVYYFKFSITKAISLLLAPCILALFFILALFLTTNSTQAFNEINRANVQLAEVYNKQNVQDYLISEKYDGVRAIWKDRTLQSRNGNIIHAPTWFTEGLPDIWLDGELWYRRGDFEYVVSTVNKDFPINSEWKNITYMVFDAPNYHADFQSRATFYTSLIQSLHLEHVRAVDQFSLSTNAELSTYLANYVAEGAEGLMLQKADAKFAEGRTSNLLKLKPYMDAEASVLAHLEGKGKYRNKVGALLVLYTNALGSKITFKIGSGFSDAERANPPPIGSVISFKYHGYTKRGVPRFASYLRMYEP